MLGFYNPNDMTPPDTSPVHYYCPECGKRLDDLTLFRRKHGDVIGCDKCIKIEWVDYEEFCPECEGGVYGGERLYKAGDEVIGCENCVEEIDAEDYYDF